jgi:hypothetical protein
MTKFRGDGEIECFRVRTGHKSLFTAENSRKNFRSIAESQRDSAETAGENLQGRISQPAEHLVAFTNKPPQAHKPGKLYP